MANRLCTPYLMGGTSVIDKNNYYEHKKFSFLYLRMGNIFLASIAGGLWSGPNSKFG